MEKRKIGKKRIEKKKNGIRKEIASYLIFGILTTFVSIAVYAVLTIPFGMNELIANVISWLICVLFAFLTNRIWVFRAPTHGWKDFFLQMGTFYVGRIVTLIIEEGILAIFITWMGFNGMIVKVIAQGVVIVGNYVISKWIVFRKK